MIWMLPANIRTHGSSGAEAAAGRFSDENDDVTWLTLGGMKKEDQMKMEQRSWSCWLMQEERR